MMNGRSWSCGLLGVAAVLAMAGCATAPAAPPTSDAAKEKKPPSVTVQLTADGSRQVQHAGGTTVVPAHPERIATLDCVDEVLALGMRPCVCTSTWGVVRPYAAKELAGVPVIESMYGASEPPYEAVLAARPDLILVSGGTMRRPQRLSAIAPTVVIEGDNPRQRLRDVAEVLGVPERATAVIAAYQAKLDAAKAILKERLHGESVAVIRVRARRYQLLGGTWMGPLFNRELGLTPPEMVKHRLLSSKLASLYFDAELITELDAEHLFVIINPQLMSDGNTAALEDVPGWDQVPAVRHGNVYYVSQSNWLVGQSLVAYGVVTDEIVSAILHEGRFAAPADTPDARKARIAEVFRTREPAIRASLIQPWTGIDGH